MYFYTAYELLIRSQIPLPGLVAVETVSEHIAIHVRKLSSSERVATGNGRNFLGETVGVGMFLVRDGNEVIVDPAPGVDESLLRAILLGPIMAVLLRQRGLAVLHASAIVIDGQAVAFLGQSGRGKSTLAEVFYKRGYGVVTDDVMAVSVDGKCPQVIPGYPSIKLFPDAAAYLGCEASVTHKVHAQTEKRAYSVMSTFPTVPLTLRRMYALAGGECNEIEPLRPQEVFLELVQNARAVTLLKDPDSLNANLRQCARLATEVPVFRLRRRPDLSTILDLVQLIEEDLA